MKLNKIILIAVAFVFSSQCFALAVDEWEYKEVTGTLKATPGCKTKEKATKQASEGYRYGKYTKLLCTDIAYGWSKENVVDKGQLVCEACEDWDDEDDTKDNGYSCFMQDVVVKCRTVKKGW